MGTQTAIASPAGQAIVPAGKNVQPPALTLSERARHYAKRSKSPGTIKHYATAWAEFVEYARRVKAQDLPADPSTVLDYLSDLADHGAAFATIAVKRAAIVYMHRINHVPDPTDYEEVTAVMSGISREIGTAQQGKDPITLAELKRMIKIIPVTPKGRRDRALILLGFAGAFRRSELVALNAKDIEIKDTLRVTVRQSKTDQARRGFVKIIPLDLPEAIDPVSALTVYLDELNITSGPIFRKATRWGLTKTRLDAQSVNLILKHYAVKVGLDPDRFGGHSLRAGFITTAYQNGSRPFEIMELTGQKSDRTVARYVRLAGQGAQSAVRAAFTGK